MKISTILNHLESRFPLTWQEEFDNCGVQCGNRQQEITGALICFDISESVVNEAIALEKNLIISHHPLIFGNGLKNIEPNNTVGRIICKALQNNILIYSMHTCIDAGTNGGNDLFAEKLNLQEVKLLSPKRLQLQKLSFYVPVDFAAPLKDALFALGCGQMGNYECCCYTQEGIGSFKPKADAQPFIGEQGREETVPEQRIELLFPPALQSSVIKTLYRIHPYEEPAFDITPIIKEYQNVGLGRIGKLAQPMEIADFYKFLKEQLELKTFRVSGKINKKIEKVALCGGSGSSFIKTAFAAGADIYITGDVRYHDFFIADNQMIIADIGHFESEHFIREIICAELKRKFTNFATAISTTEKLEIAFV
ncbi:MAG: Nif3-like dinuclear metal center hexameric protein [Bacteroidales bacterium]|jgi:dinuclear metal center YbgI/SA1388 family protein|nr:Nif3-like dinuclear metal center hexameric protein [Bacteroidales bacterium]